MSEFTGHLLAAVGIASAITCSLTILILIADATIANYGEVTITINDDKKIVVEGGKSLLGTLKEQEIFIPSACGGRGSCGLCKAVITEGAGDVLPTELPWLTPEERSGNVRLSCQVKVKRDLKMTVPKGLLSVRQFATEVTGIRDLTYDIKEVTLKLLEPSGMDFTPGQFAQFEVPEYELTREPVYRAYSIASDAKDRGTIQLEIRLVPNGICTTYVHKHLRVGERVTINGPHGEFCLRDTTNDIIFIAGGSGMAPIRSILFDMAEKKSERKATYFFGAKAKRDLFLIDEMKRFEKQLPNFRFVAALSSPDAADNWDGETGLITEVVERMMGDGAAAEAYLCGSPGMIDASIKCLIKGGVSEDRIYYDKFA